MGQARLRFSSKRKDAMTYAQITHEERYAISELRKLGYKNAAIARELGRHRSNVGREVRRNAWREHGRTYRSVKAQSNANQRRSASRSTSQFSAEEWALVASVLREDVSPEQVVG